MKKEYDFSGAKPNPYTNRLKSRITIDPDTETIEYFKEQSANCGIPCQALISLYLADCARNKRKLTIAWT